LSAARYGPTGFANTGVAGYSAGGFDWPPNAGTTTVDKFAFPSDTRSSLGTGISAAGGYGAGFADAGVAGYVSSAYTSPAAQVNKFAFPSDTRSILSSGLSANRNQPSGMADSAVAGYAGGGALYPSTFYTIVDKFAFPSDTRSTLGTGLSSARFDGAAFANEGVF
jgi:hypothetical protein